MTTVKDIAEYAGVSIGTVDRVLHGRGRVAEATERRVLEAIESLGYSPNMHARNLVTGRTYVFRVLSPSPDSDGGYWRLPLRGIERALGRLSMSNVSVERVWFDRHDEEGFLEVLESVGEEADGLLVAPVVSRRAATALLDSIAGSGIPTVSFDSRLEYGTSPDAPLEPGAQREREVPREQEIPPEPDVPPEPDAPPEPGAQREREVPPESAARPETDAPPETDVPRQPADGGIAFVGQNPWEGGQTAGRLADFLRRPGEAVASVTLGGKDSHLLERARAFRAYWEERSAAGGGAVQVYEIMLNDRDREGYVVEVTERLAPIIDEVAAVFVTNAESRLLIEAIRRIGYRGTVPLVGYDLLPRNIELLREGSIGAVISQKPEEQGYEAMNVLAQHVIFGKSVPEQILMPVEVILRENLASFLTQRVSP
ncbi:MAG: substrate-binding domain-containing protein [bacterium]